MSFTANFTDGVNVDFEGEVPAGSQERTLLNKLMADLTTMFHQRIPGSQITFDVAWSPNCIDNRCYDHKTLADNSDFLFVMDYDMRSQIWGECTASANSPIDLVHAGMINFTRENIPASKLILGVPWYGYDYECLNNKSDPCYIKPVPFRGCPCSDAAGREIELKTVMTRLATALDGRHWDDQLKSPYFTYRSGQFNLRQEHTPKADGTWPFPVHQVWYDDPESLGYKYRLAKGMGLRGIGMFMADFPDYFGDEAARKLAKEMWDAMKQFSNE